MHKLERPQAPTCLLKYRHGRNNWKALTHDDRLQIWNKIDEMQQKRCAYCECLILSDSGRKAHIEHFRQRSRYPQGTFQWENLFGSCNSEESCGNHKDRLKPYNPDDLIKMDEEDPDDFFLFVADGTIALRGDLTDDQRHRAEETLRIFNLNARNGKLRHMRKMAVAGYMETAKVFAEMASSFEQEELISLLQEELEAIADIPFVTTIRHILIPSF